MRSEKGLENQQKYILEYNKSHYKRIPLDVTFEDYERIREAAAAAGMPVNTFIKAAIQEKIDNMDDKTGMPPRTR